MTVMQPVAGGAALLQLLVTAAAMLLVGSTCFAAARQWSWCKVGVLGEGMEGVEGDRRNQCM